MPLVFTQEDFLVQYFSIFVFVQYFSIFVLSDLKKHLYVDQYCRDQPVLLNYLVEHSQIDDGMLFTFLYL